MILLETSLFTKIVGNYLDEEEYREFQNYIIEHPDSGDLIKGTGGLRKVRWGLKNTGKRGGLRIIYYWQITEEQIYLLLIYAKNEMSDLSDNDKKALKKIIEEWNYE